MASTESHNEWDGYAKAALTARLASSARLINAIDNVGRYVVAT
jgi:hypothetical protein